MSKPPVASPPEPTPSRSSKVHVLLVVAGAVSVGVVAGLFIFFPPGKPRSKTASAVPSAAVSAMPEEAPPTTSREAAPESPPAAAAKVPQLDKRHVEITVQPAAASLFLDNRPVGGNLLKIEVPSARMPHVVQARAPGYVPFRKTINFATDVYLDIRLEKVDSPSPSARPKPPLATMATQPSVAAKATPSAPSSEDFGMNLQHPPTRRSTKRIDETDPYGP